MGRLIWPKRKHAPLAFYPCIRLGPSAFDVCLPIWLAEADAPVLGSTSCALLLVKRLFREAPVMATSSVFTRRIGKQFLNSSVVAAEPADAGNGLAVVFD